MYLNTIINIYAPNLGYVNKFNGVLYEGIPLLPIKIMMETVLCNNNTSKVGPEWQYRWRESHLFNNHQSQ